MKKLVLFLICITLCLAFCSCKNSMPGQSDSSENEHIVGEGKRPDAEKLGTLEESMNITLYDRNDIKVSAVSYYTDTDGDLMLNCNISNKSSDNIFVALEYPEVNGICSTVSEMWADVKEGQETTATLEIGEDFLTLSEITTVSDLAVRFNIYDENYRIISDEKNKYIAFSTENSDYEQIIDKSGTAIIDKDDHKIIVQKSANGKEGLDVRVCYINNSDKILNFNITDALIGEDVFYVEAPAELPAYSMTYIKFTVFDSDLNRRGITKEEITSMELTASVTNVVGETLSECINSTVEFE